MTKGKRERRKERKEQRKKELEREGQKQGATMERGRQPVRERECKRPNAYMN